MGLLTILVTILAILIAMCHARPGSSRRINDPDRVSVPDEEVAQGLLQAKPTPATPSVQRHENTVGAAVDRTVAEAGELAEGLARSGTARECQSHCQNGDAIFSLCFYRARRSAIGSATQQPHDTPSPTHCMSRQRNNDRNRTVNRSDEDRPFWNQLP